MIAGGLLSKKVAATSHLNHENMEKPVPGDLRIILCQHSYVPNSLAAIFFVIFILQYCFIAIFLVQCLFCFV